jgi:hypothetical protein
MAEYPNVTLPRYQQPLAPALQYLMMKCDSIIQTLNVRADLRTLDLGCNGSFVRSLILS